MTTTDIPGVTDVEEGRGHAVAMLAPFYEYRQAEKEAKGSKDMAGKLIRGYLDEHPDETLTDGEHNIRAFMRSSKGRETLSAQAVPTHMLRDLADRGVLTLNKKVYDTLKEVDPGLYLDVQHYIGHGEGSTSLQVVKDDRD